MAHQMGCQAAEAPPGKKSNLVCSECGSPTGAVMGCGCDALNSQQIAARDQKTLQQMQAQSSLRLDQE
jgi:hypothetical protein